MDRCASKTDMSYLSHVVSRQYDLKGLMFECSSQLHHRLKNRHALQKFCFLKTIIDLHSTGISALAFEVVGFKA